MEIIKNIFLILLLLPGMRYFGSIYYLLLASSLFISFNFIIKNKIFIKVSFVFLLLLYSQQFLQFLFIFDKDQDLFNSIARITIPILLILFFNSSKKNSIKLYKCLFFANLLALLSLYFQLIFPDILPLPLDGFRGSNIRFSTFGGNTNILGTSLALYLPFLIYSESDFDYKKFFFQKSKTFSNNKIKAFFIFLYLITIFLTYSRGALLTFGFTIILYIFLEFIEFNNIDYSFRFKLQKRFLNYFIYLPLIFLISFAFIVLFVPNFTLIIAQLFFPFTMMLTLLNVIPKEYFWNLFPNISLDASDLNLLNDFFKTRVAFGMESISSSFGNTLSFFFGIGPSSYGSIVGFEEGFNHNNYFDLLEGQGLLGVFIFLAHIVILFCLGKSWDSNQKKLLILSTSTFLVASLYSSGILHHPLWITPLIIVPGIPIFYKIKKVS